PRDPGSSIAQAPCRTPITTGVLGSRPTAVMSDATSARQTARHANAHLTADVTQQTHTGRIVPMPPWRPALRAARSSRPLALLPGGRVQPPRRPSREVARRRRWEPAPARYAPQPAQ